MLKGEEQILSLRDSNEVICGVGTMLGQARTGAERQDSTYISEESIFACPGWSPGDDCPVRGIRRDQL